MAQQLAQGILTACRCNDPSARAGKQRFHAHQRLGIVVDDQDVSCRFCTHERAEFFACRTTKFSRVIAIPQYSPVWRYSPTPRHPDIFPDRPSWLSPSTPESVTPDVWD